MPAQTKLIRIRLDTAEKLARFEGTIRAYYALHPAPFDTNNVLTQDDVVSTAIWWAEKHITPLLCPPTPAHKPTLKR